MKDFQEKKKIYIESIDFFDKFNSIEKIKKYKNINEKDIKFISTSDGTGIHSNNDSKYKSSYLNSLKTYHLSHHLSHASSAFFTSKFKKSLIIACDGAGHVYSYYDSKPYDRENYNIKKNSIYFDSNKDFLNTKLESTSFSIWRGDDNKIYPLKIYGNWVAKNKAVSIGFKWNEACEKLFNLNSNAAGTVMAMASCGDSNKYYNDFYNWVSHGINAHQNHSKFISKYKNICNKSEKDSFDVAAALQKATEEFFLELIEPFIKD